jgi:guanine nucleotide-binding protein subunit gamma, fungi
MSELKLRRLLEHNQRLREDLGRPRIRVSEASASLIRYCKTTTDHLVSLPYSLSIPSFFRAPVLMSDYDVQVPSVWGPVGKNDDPYAPQTGGGCCTLQ